MFDPANPVPYIVGLLVLIVAYFIKDQHSKITNGIEAKATRKELDEAKESWRTDLRETREAHQKEAARMERQYEQRFSAVVQQFQGRMDSMEKSLTDKIDLVLHIIERRNNRD